VVTAKNLTIRGRDFTILAGGKGVAFPVGTDQQWAVYAMPDDGRPFLYFWKHVNGYADAREALREKGGQ